jgi:hypothetical protein
MLLQKQLLRRLEFSSSDYNCFIDCFHSAATIVLFLHAILKDLAALLLLCRELFLFLNVQRVKTAGDPEAAARDEPEAGYEQLKSNLRGKRRIGLV